MKEAIPLIIPILGISAGLIIPLAVFIWLYYEEKGKRAAVIEIAKHVSDSSKVEKLLAIFVGIGIFLLGFVALGALFEGVGLLVCAIGVGTMIAGYLYPNTSEELTNAVEEFENK